MTELKKDFKEMAEKYVVAIDEGNDDAMGQLAAELETQEEKTEGLAAILDLLDSQDDEFKTKNATYITALKEIQEIQLQALAADCSEPAEAEEEATGEVEAEEVKA